MKVAAKEGRRVLKPLKRRPEDLDPERHACEMSSHHRAGAKVISLSMRSSRLGAQELLSRFLIRVNLSVMPPSALLPRLLMRFEGSSTFWG